MQTLSRKDKQSIRKRSAEASQLQNMEDVGDIGDFADLDHMTESLFKSNTGAGEGTRGGSKKERAQTDSMQHAVRAFAQSTTGPKKGTRNDDDMPNIPDPSLARRNRYREPDTDMDALGGDDDDDDGFGGGYGDEDDGGDDVERLLQNQNSGKRRRAPDGPMGKYALGENDDDEGDSSNLLEDFARKKKEFLKKKKDHYAVEPTYAGVEIDAEEGEKRGVSYEILKNKGVTAYRKVSVKNPRVKKRKAYEKAVVARKGQVRDVIKGAAGSYGGEGTGIKSNLSRSRKF